MLVHARVCNPQQVLAHGCVGWVRCGADVDCEAQVVDACGVYGSCEPASGLLRVAGALAWQDGDEFVAAPACDHVSVAGVALQCLRDEPQGFVAFCMSEGVVDSLEVGHVQHQQGQLLAGVFGTPEGAVEFQLQASPVKKICDGIGHRGRLQGSAIVCCTEDHACGHCDLMCNADGIEGEGILPYCAVEIQYCADPVILANRDDEAGFHGLRLALPVDAGLQAREDCCVGKIGGRCMLYSRLGFSPGSGGRRVPSEHLLFAQAQLAEFGKAVACSRAERKFVVGGFPYQYCASFGAMDGIECCFEHLVV